MRSPFKSSRIPMTRVRWPAFAAAAVLTAAAGALGACHPAPKANVEAPPRAVRVARVQAQPLASALTISGLLTPREEAAVTSELGGYRVSQVFVDQGDWVKQGQPLAQLDDTLLRSQIAQQSAVLTQQTLAAERAESQARNVAGLDNQGVLSQEDIDTRRFQAKSARASAVAAQAQLDDLKTRQARLTLRAPVSGRVLARYVRPGDLPAGQTAGQPLFRIARDGLIEIDAEVPEGDLGKLRPGQNAEVTLPDGGKTAGGGPAVQARPRPHPAARARRPAPRWLRLRPPARREDRRPGGPRQGGDL
jgi:HlyD family secretion protein